MPHEGNWIRVCRANTFRSVSPWLRRLNTYALTVIPPPALAPKHALAPVERSHSRRAESELKAFACSRAGPACSACGRVVRPDENIFETSHLFGDSTLMGLRSGDPRRPLHIGKRELRATGNRALLQLRCILGGKAPPRRRPHIHRGGKHPGGRKWDQKARNYLAGAPKGALSRNRSAFRLHRDAFLRVPSQTSS